MEIDSATVTRLIRARDITGLRRASRVLLAASRDAKLVCDAAERLRFPGRTALCSVYTRLERLHARASSHVRKKHRSRKK